MITLLAVGKELPGGWDPAYTRRMFFPYWRSVLSARCCVKAYPSYAPSDTFKPDPEWLRSWIDSIAKGSPAAPNHNLGPLQRTPELAMGQQFRRSFGTAACTRNGSSRIPIQNLSLLGRIQQPGSIHQARRLFGTVAFKLLKVLKNA